MTFYHPDLLFFLSFPDEKSVLIYSTRYFIKCQYVSIFVAICNNKKFSVEKK